MSNKGRKFKKLKFPKEDEDCMVAFMRDHPFMWDVNSKNFRNTTLKDQKWKDLAQLMGARDVEHVKKRWRNMRDYKNSKRKRDLNRAEKPTIKSITSEDDDDDQIDAVNMTFWDEYSTQPSTNESNEETDPIDINVIPSDQIDDDNYASCITDKNYFLKQLESNSNALHVAYNQASKEKSVTEKYFEAYLADIALLPTELQAKCQREVHHAFTLIINKYQDMAEEIKETPTV